MIESTLEAAEEIVGGLAVESLPVGLAGVEQHDAEDMDLATLAMGTDDWGTCIEVDLRLFTRSTLKPAEREFTGWLQAMNETTDAVVATRELMFGGETLTNTLGAQTRIALGLDHASPGLALALAIVALVHTAQDRNQRQISKACPCLEGVEAGGRIGWFWC
jgi:hypothetical protein